MSSVPLRAVDGKAQVGRYVSAAKRRSAGEGGRYRADFSPKHRELL